MKKSFCPKGVATHRLRSAVLDFKDAFLDFKDAVLDFKDNRTGNSRPLALSDRCFSFVFLPFFTLFLVVLFKDVNPGPHACYVHALSVTCALIFFLYLLSRDRSLTKLHRLP